MRAGRVVVVTAVFLALPTSSGVARAAAPATEAQALFEEARALMRDGHFAEACAKLERSDALDPGIGTQFNLARCYDLSGKFASAYVTYERVIEETHAAGQTSREAVARDLVAALEPRLARLTLVVALEGIEPGFELRLDGAPLERGTWGEPIPLDPGVHVVTASALSSKSWRREIAIDREAQSVTVAVPRLELLAQARTMTPTSDLPPPAKEATSKRGRPQRVAAIALGALGLGGIGVGGYFGLRSLSLESQASQQGCTSNGCTPAGFPLRSEAHSDGDVATVSFALSAVSLAAGIVLWLTSPSDSSSPQRHLATLPTTEYGGRPGVSFP